MPDAIMGSAYVQLEENRKLPWHKKMGGFVTIGSSASAALATLGQYDVERAPLAAYSQAGQQWYDVPTNFAILRGPVPTDPNPKVLGVVSPDYVIVQHRELAERLDTLTNVGWQVETAGLLHDGAQLFMSFNASGYVVNGDDIANYWVASVRHAESSVAFLNTPVRVVCQNTYRMAEGRSTERISIPHTSSVHQEISWTTDFLAKTQVRQEQVRQELEAFGQTPMDQDSYTRVLDATYPLPEPTRRQKAIQARVADLGGNYDSLEAQVLAEYQDLDKALEMKRALIQRLRASTGERLALFNDSRPSYANSAWAVWNSISELESHRPGRNEGYALLFGERKENLQRGYRELVQIAAAR